MDAISGWYSKLNFVYHYLIFQFLCMNLLLAVVSNKLSFLSSYNFKLFHLKFLWSQYRYSLFHCNEKLWMMSVECPKLYFLYHFFNLIFYIQFFIANCCVIILVFQVVMLSKALLQVVYSLLPVSVYSTLTRNSNCTWYQWMMSQVKFYVLRLKFKFYIWFSYFQLMGISSIL